MVKKNWRVPNICSAGLMCSSSAGGLFGVKTIFDHDVSRGLEVELLVAASEYRMINRLEALHW